MEKLPKREKAQEVDTPTAAAVDYKVNTESTSVTWTGSKPTGTHQGTINVTEGSLSVNNGQVVGGSFGLDMNSITVNDLKAGEGKEKLEGHLKTGDFFETEKYPVGKFTITKVEPVSGSETATHNVTGNLTLKDQTHSVTIPANIAVSGEKITAVTPKFTINRTTWGINYNSGILGTVKDKLINDDVALVINLTAAK